MISIISSVVKMNNKPVLIPYKKAYNPRKIMAEPVEIPKGIDNSLFFIKSIPASRDEMAIHKSAKGKDINQFAYPGTKSSTGNIPVKTNNQ